MKNEYRLNYRLISNLNIEVILMEEKTLTKDMMRNRKHILLF